MSKPQIHTWFPKTIFMVDDVLTSMIPTYESKIKEIVNTLGSRRDGMNFVDSTHSSHSQLHTLPEFKDLADTVLHNAVIFLSELGYDTTITNRIKIVNMWANISYPGDFIFPHVHDGSILSGVFYVKKFEGSQIKFFNNLYKMITVSQMPNNLSYEFCTYDCNPGRILMWQSDFLHGTERQPAGEKIVISYNLGYS